MQQVQTVESLIEEPEFIKHMKSRLDEVGRFIRGGGFQDIYNKLSEEYSVQYDEERRTIELRIDKRKNRELLWETIQDTIIEIVGREYATYYHMFASCDMSSDYIFIKKRYKE